MVKAFLCRSLSLVLLLVFFSGSSAAYAQTVGPVDPVDLRIMTFNIWMGGELVDFDQVVEAIKAADADIVGLQEAIGNTRRLADALGWSYASERMQIISRFPLIDPPDGNGLYIFAQIKPGAVVALANAHLPSDPYGPYAVRDGAALAEVLELEQATRLPMIAPHLPKFMALTQASIPVLLTGDFNAPSHRDWTTAMIGTRTGLDYTVEWPVSTAVEAAGFVDTYRAAHPNPAKRPGITWTYGYPYPRLKPDEVIDRIDFVFAAGAVEVLKSQIVGETGTPDADIGISPYPSDHRGVVSTLRVTPGSPPYFVAAQSRLVRVGEPIVVRYHAPMSEGSDRIVLVAGGGDAINDALMWLPPYEASFFGSVTFGSTLLAPGEYEVALIGVDDTEIARHSFWIIAPTHSLQSVRTKPPTKLGKLSLSPGRIHPLIVGIGSPSIAPAIPISPTAISVIYTPRQRLLAMQPLIVVCWVKQCYRSVSMKCVFCSTMVFLSWLQPPLL